MPSERRLRCHIGHHDGIHPVRQPGAAAAVYANPAGLDGDHYGIWNSPRGIGTALCMPLVGYLGKGGAHWMLIFAFALRGRLLLRLCADDARLGTWDIFWIQIVQGFALGFPLCAADHADSPRFSRRRYGTSLYNTMRNIGWNCRRLVCDHAHDAASFTSKSSAIRSRPSSAMGQQAFARLTLPGAAGIRSCDGGAQGRTLVLSAARAAGGPGTAMRTPSISWGFSSRPTSRCHCCV